LGDHRGHTRNDALTAHQLACLSDLGEMARDLYIHLGNTTDV
jgi:hypothetical protein